MTILSTADVLFLKATFVSLILWLAKTLSLRLRKFRTPNNALNITLPSPKPTARTLLPPTRSISKALARARKDCIIFYGSQTSTAERFALQFAKEGTRRYNLQSIVADVDDFDFDDLKTLPPSKVVVFLLATFGEGEPTDNAIGFNGYLQTRVQSRDYGETTISLDNLRYAVFGLGNSSYRQYNAMAKRLDTILSCRSAIRLGVMGLGDDGKGTLEDDFITWMDATLAELAGHLNLKKRDTIYEPSYDIIESDHRDEADIFLGEPNKAQLRNKIRGPFSASNPFPAHIVKFQQLFSADSERKCVHIEFDTNGSTITYETGDHLAISPVNFELEVERFLRTFGLIEKRDRAITITSRDPTLSMPLPGKTTYAAAARYYLDICAPISRLFLTALAPFASKPSGAAELLRLSTNQQAFQECVKDRSFNIAQLLEVISPGTIWDTVPFPLLLENIGKLKPRFYSISSSSLVSKRRISITAVVESDKSIDSPFEFKGVATNYPLALHSEQSQTATHGPSHTKGVSFTPKVAVGTSTHLTTGPRGHFRHPSALIYVRKSKFRLPKNPSVPVIMIGPGTGVAPFRGFVQERAMLARAGRDVGKTVLFYGCRRADEDFLYRDEWEELSKSFPPSTFSLHAAFSRQDANRKIYVHGLLLEQASVIKALILAQGAHVYVRGDASRMAKDVFKVSASIIAEDDRFTGNVAEAENYLVELKSKGWWCEDVW